MENNFVPYELALALNKLGCKLFINYVFQDEQEPYPTIEEGILWQQAFDWLFKEFNFWQYTFPNAHNKDWCYHIQWYKESFGWGESFIQNGFKTQEEARLECLKKLIEISKEKCNIQ